MAPDAANHVQVERHIASLQALVDQQQQDGDGAADVADASHAAWAGTTDSPAATARRRRASRHRSTPERACDDRTTRLTASAPRARPVTKKAWFWGVVAGGAVVVVGAVVLGVVLGTRDHAKNLSDLRF